MKRIFESYGREYDQFFLGVNGRSALNKKFSDVDIELYPGITSSSPNTWAFLSHLSESLRDKFPLSHIENGLFIGPPITTDFAELKTKAGSIRPLPYPDHREAILTELPRDLKDNLRSLMSVRYRSTNWINKNASVSNNSSSGAPFFRHSAADKIQHIRYVIDRFSRFKTLCENDDHEALFKEMGLLFVSNAQVRRQNDKWIEGSPKIRKYKDFVSSHMDSDTSTYSRDDLLYSYKGSPTGLASCRTRVVKAFAAPINYIMTGAIVNIRDGADHRYAFTYKHRGPDDILRKITRFGYFKGLDVSSFDSNVGYELAYEWCNNLPLQEWVKHQILKLFRAPFYTSENRLANGNPLDISTFKYWGGLPSGIFSTSMMGKDIMSAVILTGLSRLIGKLEEEKISNILDGNADIGFLNQGDDSVLMAKDKDFLDEWITSIQDVYFDIELENGVAFLGNLVYRDLKTKELKVCNNLSSYFSGVYVPERSINTLLRPYAIFGMKERREIYKLHPLFEEARNIERELFKYHFMVDQDFIEEKHMKKPTNFGVQVLSSSDIEVLTNYNKLYYKFTESEINPAIVELFSSNLPEDMKDTIMKGMINERSFHSQYFTRSC